ncbi:NAD(P)/FAD-dependent oxidoreductase [Flagellimonas sediminis]|uniref:FAD-dependent oxidoreductase n=1 Tax=Flagellimonas sediminis TaxID=2696468 RepID=A0A6I5KV49_9FLAO|nr:FAD-dependent oxidoreductase [Allomuricauda sediminis]NDV44834.1 FAD-dependent oxidoreductase [Allomuricauda sediminis]
MKKYDVLVVGGGIFGITAAVELAKRKYKVCLLNLDSVPHHLAASMDVTKAVRMEYGSDIEYFTMAERAIGIWKEWNAFFGKTLYHEVGFLMLCKESLESGRQDFEKHSYHELLKKGYGAERLLPSEISKKFPAIDCKAYTEAIYNPIGGYADATLTLTTLYAHARELGVEILEGQTVNRFDVIDGAIKGVSTEQDKKYGAEHVLVSAGVHTPVLLPELKPYMKSTGHPVFWLRPLDQRNFDAEKLPVFTADISNTGWYGFPYLKQQGIIKIAKHSNGNTIDPERGNRHVTDAEVSEMRSFVAGTFPELANAPLVYTRKCLYTDTLDGHFWIDNHPKIKGLYVSSGGSGHGLKMAPLLGPMAADVVEGKTHEFSERYRWRHLTKETVQVEEARYVIDRKI